MTTPSRPTFVRRIRELGRIAEQKDCDAKAVVGTVLALWCQADYSTLARTALPFSKPLAHEPKVMAFVEMLREASFLEATYWLSSVYAMLSDECYRKKVAMYFTPPSLTKGLLDDLARQKVDFGSQMFLDPACGGAAFLAPIALRMREVLKKNGLGPKRLLKHIECHLYGAEIDATLCVLSKQFLCMALYQEIQSTGYIPMFKVNRANSLTELTQMVGAFDVVVCNPPYRKMMIDELEQLDDKFDDVIEAQPNLYGLFIQLCVRLLKHGGYAALVTPTSFLSGQYFSKLRTFLMRNTDVAHIGMVSDRNGVFIDVAQETALAILRRRIKADPKWIRAKVSVVSATGNYENAGKCKLPNSGAAWPIPRAVEDMAVLKVAHASRFRLSDYGYRVRIGACVWNRDIRPRYGSITDVRRAKSKTALPLLWSSDITTKGVVSFDFRKMSGKEHRFVDLGDRCHTSVVTRRSVVLQRVTSNDQPKRLVAAPVPLRMFSKFGGFVGENHVVILEQVAAKPPLKVGEMAKMLGTKPVDRYFRCISGATNVSAFELTHLVLPDPVKLRAELNKGGSMEKAVHRSYGLEFEGD